MLSKKAFSHPKSFSEGKKPPLVVGNSSIKYFFCDQLSKLLYFQRTSLIVTSYLSVRINILNGKLISFLTCQYSCECVPIWLSKILSQRQHIVFVIIYFQPILAIKTLFPKINYYLWRHCCHNHHLATTRPSEIQIYGWKRKLIFQTYNYYLKND